MYTKICVREARWATQIVNYALRAYQLTKLELCGNINNIDTAIVCVMVSIAKARDNCVEKCVQIRECYYAA